MTTESSPIVNDGKVALISIDEQPLTLGLPSDLKTVDAPASASTIVSKTGNTGKRSARKNEVATSPSTKKSPLKRRLTKVINDSDDEESVSVQLTTLKGVKHTQATSDSDDDL
jgi:hypothetical protein